MARYHIVIVGGGAVGVSTAHHLVDELDRCSLHAAVDVTMLERSSIVGPGLAYSDDEPTNLLNTRAGSISVVYGERDHFYTWLQRSPEKWRDRYPTLRIEPRAFLPRSLFGLYLRDVHSQTVERARRLGVTFATLRDEAIDAVRIDDDVFIRTRAGTLLRSDFVHLCCGNLPSVAFPQFAGMCEYLNSPYPVRDLIQRIPSSSDVLIVGSRLSAIDATVALLQAGHRGRIRLVSRGGRLPSVRGDQDSFRLRGITPEIVRRTALERNGLNVDDVVDLVRTELVDGIGELSKNHFGGSSSPRIPRERDL